MTIKLIPYNSETYHSMVGLRYEILRKPLGLAFTEEELAKDEKDVLVGAFEGDKLIGCCILTHINPLFLKLRQMGIILSQHGKGVGRSILQFSEKFAIENGYSHLFMNARISAIGFYEKSGYRIVSDIFEEVGIPHYRMEKVL
jgi:predicted GNAT family N-acyltransferase